MVNQFKTAELNHDYAEHKVRYEIHHVLESAEQDSSVPNELIFGPRTRNLVKNNFASQSNSIMFKLRLKINGGIN